MSIIINNKKLINAWCSYDIANSVYNLIITTVLFPIYYQAVTGDFFTDGIIPFLCFSLKNTVLYDYTIAFAYLVIIFLSPILSGIADYTGMKKRFMQIFTTLGSVSCFMLYWFEGENIYYGIILVSLAVIGFSGSLLFYNSFLPIIATPDLHDRISARAYAWGYGGSMFLLLINILTIENFASLGFSDKLQALKLAFPEVGIWWISISQIAFYFLEEQPLKHKVSKHYFIKGFQELTQVFKFVKSDKSMILFLPAFFFWSMGVQTIILVAGLFGSSELGITGSKLIIMIFILQLLAIFGAYLFGFVSEKFGNKTSLSIMLIIWIGVCISGYFIETEKQLYLMASFVGLVMGGIQSQSRSTYSKLLPKNTRETASFFSFYDITEKMAIVLGMFSFGFVEQITGSMRNSTLILSLFFILGLTILLFAHFPKHYKPKK